MDFQAPFRMHHDQQNVSLETTLSQIKLTSNLKHGKTIAEAGVVTQVVADFYKGMTVINLSTL